MDDECIKDDDLVLAIGKASVFGLKELSELADILWDFMVSITFENVTFLYIDSFEKMSLSGYT